MNFFLFLLVVSGWLFGASAKAVCPVCAIAVGAGVGLSRYLGIDDTIAGLWIGGLSLSLSLWTIDWFDRKKIQFKYRAFITTLAYDVLIVVPLYCIGIIC